METLGKGLTVLEVFMDFENRFDRLSTRDQAILALDKVVMFLKAIDVRDCKDFGVLLEDATMDCNLMNTWGNVWDIMARCTKRWQWLGEEEHKSSETALRPRTAIEEHQPWN